MRVMEKLCREVIGLSDEEIGQLVQIESNLQYMSDLVGADVFIDCFYENGTKCMVVAEAKPMGNLSVYDRWVVGENADMQNEPAVFAVRSTGMPVRDLRATTQEHKLVRQDVIPIRNANGEIFGVLIREKDVSEQIRQDKKFHELAQIVREMGERLHSLQAAADPAPISGGIELAETHHRIKNNLQMVASILNMQARRSSSPEVRNIFKGNVSRVLSFAAIHDILTRKKLEDNPSVMEIINNVRRHTIIYSNHDEKRISIKIEGSDFRVPADKAISIALVINELLANAVKHAFEGRAEGTVTISVNHGSIYSSVTVSDDGVGFEPSEKLRKNIGFSLVEATVREKLHGKLQTMSGKDGTKIRFDFKN